MHLPSGHFPAGVVVQAFLYTSLPHFLPTVPPPPGLFSSLPISLPLALTCHLTHVPLSLSPWQWKPVEQDLQAQEAHPGGHSPV